MNELGLGKSVRGKRVDESKGRIERASEVCQCEHWS